MVRQSRPEIRDLLIERTAAKLARREPVSLRSVVAGTGLSTMAVYTYFDGMPGLLGAVRQEGFKRLAERLAAVAITADPVSDVAAVSAAYSATAVDSPDLYKVMFDGGLPLPDPAAADAALHQLIDAVQRAVAGNHLPPDTDAVGFANELWMLGHGACMLVVNGILPYEQIEPVLLSGLGRHLQMAGGDRPGVRRSVTKGWRRGAKRSGRPAGPTPTQ